MSRERLYRNVTLATFGGIVLELLAGCAPSSTPFEVKPTNVPPPQKTEMAPTPTATELSQTYDFFVIPSSQIDQALSQDSSLTQFSENMDKLITNVWPDKKIDDVNITLVVINGEVTVLGSLKEGSQNTMVLGAGDLGGSGPSPMIGEPLWYDKTADGRGQLGYGDFLLIEESEGVEGSVIAYTRDGGRVISKGSLTESVFSGGNKVESILKPITFDGGLGIESFLFKDGVLSGYDANGNVIANYDFASSSWVAVESAEVDAWPFPDDPVVESIKLSEDEMKVNNPEFYNEVAPILTESGIVVEKWMQHPDTGEVFMLVHHKDGGGQFMMTNHKYSNGYVLLGFNTRETPIAMENLWLQPADDGRLLAITLQDAPNGNSLDSMWMDLAAMAHLRNRVGMGNMPGTLEKMKAAIAAERVNMGSDRINFVYLVTPTDRGEEIPPNPFPEMHTFVENRGLPALKTDIIFSGNTVLIGSHDQRDGFVYPVSDNYLRGLGMMDRVKQHPELLEQLSKLPDFTNILESESQLYGGIIGTTMANLAEGSMEKSWFVMDPYGFLSSEPKFADSLEGVNMSELLDYMNSKSDVIPEQYISNWNERIDQMFMGAQLVK